MNETQKYILGIAIIIVILVVISFCLGLFTTLSILPSFRIIFGSVYVLFLPGFILSFIFFPKTRAFEDKDKRENGKKGNTEDKKENREERKRKNGEREKGSIDWIERLALSFALSIAVVPLVVFYLNLIGVKINLLNSFLTILGIIVVSSIILVFRIKKTEK